ncbi:growth arrest-specific protein 7-like [Paralichthys olivaceus]|uniref:growth arrest-specific protein 7-like n=1 Tax=Paralichthys olivaceus TaxID=8255 RepID=UPI0037529512
MKSAVVSSTAPGEETGSQPLPPGWRSYMSPEGQRYYVNSCSKETTWRRPSSSDEALRSLLARQNSSPYEEEPAQRQAAAGVGGGRCQH